MSYNCLYSAAALHHYALAGAYFPPVEDSRLSLPGWPLIYQDEMGSTRER